MAFYKIDRFEITKLDDSYVYFKVRIIVERWLMSNLHIDHLGYGSRIGTGISSPTISTTGHSFHLAYSYEISQAIAQLCLNPDQIKSFEKE